MLFSTATGYALQTLAALPDDGGYYLARSLAKQLNLPGPYLAKILQNLVQAGILESVRGPKGGFRLARSAQSVTVGAIVEVMEGGNVLQRCIMGFTDCNAEVPCPLHPAWDQAKTQMTDSMTQVTLQDLQVCYIRSQPPARLHASNFAIPARSKNFAPGSYASAPWIPL